uniref:Uncharacterized protein n=1 Tax=Hucho hucho TaxID=62062 RepID=A0A4W5QIN3_9TELE
MLWCSIPGCANYKQVQAAGWLAAELNLKNAAYDVKTLVEKYQNVCVGSQRFQPEDFETDLKSQLMRLPGRRTLKCEAIPSIFTFTSKRKPSDQPTNINYR